ncbi:uncharacterized protein K452DRAFT_80501 [Aplosporella prunicola CBS 121167]|uniref:MARVEL domain-containing protein n=1 Tax=Aplosporella prunicola CBS 121167 TaxID=1176127 RepID=A0A6A6B4W1_9PEZI|nr:uncharacterized protein K452DRAFT_80501 [Aplosporella prunicola CBS 121167]KAF2139070.1 hypothetical protein K452DRAFT_80501 [Aplosporella prunicola CBS 121167]
MEKLQQHSHSGGAYAALARISWRFLQFVMALTVIGLYGVDLQNASKAHIHADGKWVYAVVLGGISCLITIVYLIPQIPSLKLALFVDWVAFILWLALFGLFGKMYIGEKVEGDSGIQRMKNAVWVDLVNMVLWFISATYASLWTFYNRRGVDVSRSEV